MASLVFLNIERPEFDCNWDENHIAAAFETILAFLPGRISSVEAAAAITAPVHLYGPSEPTDNKDENIFTTGVYLWCLWGMQNEVLKQIPHDHSWHSSMVDLLAAIQKVELPAEARGILIWGSPFKWENLPIFGPNAREDFDIFTTFDVLPQEDRSVVDGLTYLFTDANDDDTRNEEDSQEGAEVLQVGDEEGEDSKATDDLDEDPERRARGLAFTKKCNGEQMASFVAFLAKITVIGLQDFRMYASCTLCNALEERRTVKGLDAQIPAATTWILYAGTEIYADDTICGGGLRWVRRLLKDKRWKEEEKRGFPKEKEKLWKEKERWMFWKERLGEIGRSELEIALETRRYAVLALKRMDEIEMEAKEQSSCDWRWKQTGKPSAGYVLLSNNCVAD